MDQSLFNVIHQIVKLVVYLLLREAVNDLGYLVFTSSDGGRQACPPLAYPKDGKDETWLEKAFRCSWLCCLCNGAFPSKLQDQSPTLFLLPQKAFEAAVTAIGKIPLGLFMSSGVLKFFGLETVPATIATYSGLSKQSRQANSIE